ncbi:hypothetical protein [Pseudomonas sp. MB-090624]|uniref:hypothetical protein n=1 Tax=Pseudomonas sp. MB-090624 TaxID=2213078 RepID=UPI0011B3F264|nr:hypothetical protein [Pseudomonas sp. MB-090624]
MHEYFFNTPVFDDVATCSTVSVTFEVERETLIDLDHRINGAIRENPVSLYSQGYKTLCPHYNNEKLFTLINNQIDSEDIVRNLMMCTHMMRNGLTYLTFIYKLKIPVRLTFTSPAKEKFCSILNPCLMLDDCSTLTIRLKQLSQRIMNALGGQITDNPVFSAEIISKTTENYFNDDSETITPSCIIHRGQAPIEIICTQSEHGRYSAFYVPLWVKLPFFGFYVQSGDANEELLTERLGIDFFSHGPHICMSFYEKVNQDLKMIEGSVSKFLNKRNHSDLESLTSISSFSDKLHAVSEKISILMSASREQLFAESYTNAFQSSLHSLQNRANDLQSFLRARHPLKESLLQVEQIKTNRIFSIMFAILAGVQVFIAFITVDWTGDGLTNNNIYKNLSAIYHLFLP